jgi:hypothetical protein
MPQMNNAAGPQLEMRQSFLGPLFVQAYRIRPLRPLIVQLVRRTEGGAMFSRTLRIILRKYERVHLGDYTYGAVIRPGTFDAGTVIGTFTSFAIGLQILRRNHPIGRVSLHPLWFNPILGLVPRDTIPNDGGAPLTIGSDVWIGMNVIICPGCRNIGNGAIIGAGAVVTRDVPAYTIVAGNPARPIRKRFTPEVEAAVAASNWWRLPLSELVRRLDLFTTDLTEDSLRQFSSAFPGPSSPQLLEVGRRAGSNS